LHLRVRDIALQIVEKKHCHLGFPVHANRDYRRIRKRIVDQLQTCLDGLRVAQILFIDYFQKGNRHTITKSLKVFHSKADSKSRIRGDDLEVVSNEGNRIGVVARRVAPESNRENETRTE
jgi:hypothetical protein